VGLDDLTQIVGIEWSLLGVELNVLF